LIARLSLTLLLVSTRSGGGSPCPVERAMTLLDARRYGEARAVLEPCAGEEAADARLAIALARVRLAFRDEKGAVRLLEHAQRREPGNSEIALWLGRAYGQRTIHATVFEQPSLAVRVRKSFERAVALDPDSLEARFGLLEYLLRAPNVLGGSPEKAREQAREIQRRDALQGVRGFGRIAEQEQRWVDADEVYERGMRDFPGAEGPVLWRSALAARLKNWDRAFDLLEAWVSTHPRDPRACYEIGRVAAASGQRLDRGEERLKSYLERGPGADDPPLADAHLRLGQLYQKKGERALARGEYEEALRLDPGLTEARTALARLR
jgi:tetratricopeptide (TPR) repeat protein